MLAVLFNSIAIFEVFRGKIAKKRFQLPTSKQANVPFVKRIYQTRNALHVMQSSLRKTRATCA